MEQSRKHNNSEPAFDRVLSPSPPQVGHRGHCSVEDARAALDLYKLVEGEWERDLMPDDADDTKMPSFASSNHYMHDEYWPDDVTAESQWEESDASTE